MVDAHSIEAAITSLNNAGALLKSFFHLKSISEVQGKVIELQSVILAAQSSALTAQSEQAALLNEKRKLEEDIARIKSWEETKKRYRLIEVEDIATPLYALKEECKESEASHWICSQCYEDGRKSILAINENIGSHGTSITCSHCGMKIMTRWAGFKPRYAK
jgi:DNA-directed RNA polymerase subunit RPC12/RpoP